MKYSSLVISFLLTLGHSAEGRQGSCAFAHARREAAKRADQAYAAEVGRIQALIQVHTAEVNRANEKIPETEQHVNTCRNINRSAVEAESALGLAIQLLEDVAVNSQYLDQAMAELGRQVLANENLSLSQAIREYLSQSGSFWPDSEKKFLHNLAKALEILGQKEVAWKTKVRSWLQSYLEGQSSKRTDLLSHLRILKTEVEHANAQVASGCKAASERLAALNVTKTGNQAAINQLGQELAAHGTKYPAISLENGRAKAAVDNCGLTDDTPRGAGRTR